MRITYEISTQDCLDADYWDRGLVLQNIIKTCLTTGNIERASRALLDLRKLFGEQAKIFETLTPYLPMGRALSQELAEYRLSLVVEKAAETTTAE